MGIAKGSQRVQLTMSKRLVYRLEVLADEAGMSKSMYIAMLLDQKWKEGSHTDTEDDVLIV